MPDPPARAVVFDLDGLMFNTEQLYEQVGDEVLRRRGRRMTDELRRQMMGRPGRDALQIMIDLHGLDDTAEQLQQESVAIFTRLLDTDFAPMPGLVDLLERLERAGCPKAIATSSQWSVVERMLARFAYADGFQFVLTSDDVWQGKPHPEIYLEAARRFRLRPAEMLVLEDSGVGCRSAVAAGALVVAVPGEHSRDHAFDGVAFVAAGLDDPRILSVLGLERAARQ